MIKGMLVWKYSEQPERVEPLVVPPAALPGTCTSEALWAALCQRMPVMWNDLAELSEVLGLMIGRDSHPANIRLVRSIIAHKSPNVLVLDARCCMHQLQISLKEVYCLPALACHNEIFCIAKLLNQGKILRMVRKHAHLIIDGMQIKYTKPNAAARAYAQMMLDLTFLSPTPEAEG